MVWALKTGLTPPQGICACPIVRNFFWSLMCLCSVITCISFDTLPLMYEFGLGCSFFRAVWGSRPGVHCTCWRPGFDLQMFKFVVFFLLWFHYTRSLLFYITIYGLLVNPKKFSQRHAESADFKVAIENFEQLWKQDFRYII